MRYFLTVTTAAILCLAGTTAIGSTPDYTPEQIAKITSAAGIGDVENQIVLAECYDNGWTVPEDNA
jgi:predicted outer membrane protein